MNNNFLSKIDPELDGKIVSAGMGKWLYYPNQQPLVMHLETLNYDRRCVAFYGHTKVIYLSFLIHAIQNPVIRSEEDDGL